MAEFFSRHEETRVDDILAVDLHYWIGLTDFAFEGIGVKGISGSRKKSILLRSLDVAGKS